MSVTIRKDRAVPQSHRDELNLLNSRIAATSLHLQNLRAMRSAVLAQIGEDDAAFDQASAQLARHDDMTLDLSESQLAFAPPPAKVPAALHMASLEEQMGDEYEMQ